MCTYFFLNFSQPIPASSPAVPAAQTRRYRCEVAEQQTKQEKLPVRLCRKGMNEYAHFWQESAEYGIAFAQRKEGNNPKSKQGQTPLSEGHSLLRDSQYPLPTASCLNRQTWSHTKKHLSKSSRKIPRLTETHRQKSMWKTPPDCNSELWGTPVTEDKRRG